MSDIIKIISPDTLRENRLPPGQRLTEKWPVLHYGKVYHIKPEDWTLKITGLVARERAVTYSELAALPRVEVFSDIHCVTTWSRYNNTWEGVATSAIKDLVAIKPDAKYVMVQGEGGFTTNLPLSDFFADDALFALKHDGQPVSDEHGGPVRLVVPRLYFWKSAKWLTGLKFQAKNEPGFWEKAGYHMHGDPWTEERYGGR
ncbi:MAG: sulfite oxidase-like oxidoreductase [Dehalococcoidales bacterium]|jgi:DMSO/TMAO reductase YedYZ molybdopterin-dependent catalytic subunit